MNHVRTTYRMTSGYLNEQKLGRREQFRTVINNRLVRVTSFLIKRDTVKLVYSYWTFKNGRIRKLTATSKPMTDSCLAQQPGYGTLQRRVVAAYRKDNYPTSVPTPRTPVFRRPVPVA